MSAPSVVYSKKENSFHFKHRTILVIIVISIVLHAIFAVASYREIKEIFTQRAATQLDALATLQKDRIEDYVSTNTLVVQSVLRSNNFQNLVNSFVHDPASMKLNATAPTSQQVALTAYLNNVRFADIGIRTISIIDTNGLVIASTDQKQIGLNDLQQLYFQKGQQAVDVSNFFKDTSGFKGLYLTGPIIYNGQHMGVVVIEEDAQKIYDIFGENAGLGATGQWGLAVKNANGDALSIVPGRFSDPNSAFVTTVSKSDTTAPVIRAINGQEGVFWNTPDANNIPVIAATRYIPETGWGISLKITQAEVYQPLIQLRNFFIIIFVLLCALFIVFVLHMTRLKYVMPKDNPKS